MLTSLALILLSGFALGEIFKKLRLPSLLGMLIAGMVLGPHALNLLDTSTLLISADLRQIALIIILSRAGLALDINDLKKVGRPALLMCFVPASFEIAGMMLLAPALLGLTLLEAAILGAVVSAVSPAVIVPKMLRLMETGHGARKSIPQMIMAGASADDIFVIVLFGAFTGLAQGEGISPASFLQIPVSIITGLAAGISLGLLFSRMKLGRNPAAVILMLGISFLLVAAEKWLPIPFSGLLAVIGFTAAIQKKDSPAASELSNRFLKLWHGAEILLFVLVGATLDLKYAASAGFAVVAVILGAMVFRTLGVFICLIKTGLNSRERIFCMIAYLPKATVQAAIGGIPLALGLACGNTVLTVAVLAILITAPLGAFGIDIGGKKLLDLGGAA